MNYNWWTWYIHQRINEGTGVHVNKRTRGDHPNFSITEKIQNAEKSPRDLRRLAVTHTLVKDHHLTAMRKKTLKECEGNGRNELVTTKEGRREQEGERDGRKEKEGENTRINTPWNWRAKSIAAYRHTELGFGLCPLVWGIHWRDGSLRKEPQESLSRCLLRPLLTTSYFGNYGLRTKIDSPF